MSLDVTLTKTMPAEVYNSNITHNLAKMAEQVVVWPSNLTLRDVLWHPKEHNLKFARDIAEMLDEVFGILLAEPDRFKTYNPENGWGNYDTLVSFVYNYRNACWDNPGAEISVSR